MRRFLLLIALLFASPALAQLPAPRTNAIQPALVAETRAVAGQPVDLAIVMHTRAGWHGYGQSLVIRHDGHVLSRAIADTGNEIVFADLPISAGDK